MSGNAQPAEILDRRITRTRAALIQAFNQLVLGGPWDGFTAADVAARANVGRSTLYQHFQGKEAILGEAMRPLLSVLAEAGAVDQPEAKLDWVVAHFWEQRRFGRQLLAEGAGPVIARALATHVEARLTRDVSRLDEGPALPRPTAASLIARAQLGLLEDWLTGRCSVTAPAMAAALRRSTLALIEAVAGQG